MEDTKRDRKKEKQKTDETRNNLGKAWVAYKGVCAGSLQEFVNHLLAVHELYCQNSRDRQREALAEEGEELEEGETAQPPSPKNRHSRPNRDDRSSPESQRDAHHHGERRCDHPSETWGGRSPPHSENSQPPRRPHTMSRRSPERSLSRSRSRSLSRTRQVSRGRLSSHGELDDRDHDHDDAMPSVSGTGKNKAYLGLCVRSLPLRSSDTSLRDGLYHKFKKYGKISSVNIEGEGDDRFAVVSFKKPDDVTRALEESDSRVFFGSAIELSPHEGIAAPIEEDQYPEPDCNEYHAKATRTLYVRNLEGEIRIPDLREMFKTFGEILDIDIKRQGETRYAFIQYTDIMSVVRARRAMEDQIVGSLKIKTGFGKSLPTKCVWLDNVSEQITEKYLCQQFSRYGPLKDSILDRVKGKALVFFETVDAAHYALNEMRGRVLFGKKIQIDFASPVCEAAFIEDMERSGLLPPGTWAMGRGQRPPAASFREGREGHSSQVKTRVERGGDRQYGYNNQGGSRGRPGVASVTNSRGGYSNRLGRGMASRQTSFHERGYGQETEVRERRQGYYSDYDQEPPLRRENSFNQEPSYAYRKTEQRSLSPPRKRRAMQPDAQFPRNSRQQVPARETEGRYSNQYSERYPSPPPRARPEQGQYDDQFSDHFEDDDPVQGGRQSARGSRSLYSEPPPRREHRTPPYEDKSEPTGAFSPMSSSDYTQQSQSPDDTENYHSASPVAS